MAKIVLYYFASIALFVVIFFLVKKIGSIFDGFMSKLDKRYKDVLRETNKQNNGQSQWQKFAGKQYSNSHQNGEKSDGQRSGSQQSGWNQQHSGENIKKPEPEKKKDTLPECFVALGFTKMPKSPEDVKTRYKKLAKIYHPDGGGSEEEFQRIDKAFHDAKKIMKF